MTRKTHSFKNPNPLVGACGNALIIAALLANLSPAFAAKPADFHQKCAPAQKDVPATAKGKGANDKVNTQKLAAERVTPERIASGKQLFERLTCSGCHPNGENSLHPYRPLKGPGFLERYKEDGQIEHVIRTGVLKAGMPSFSKLRLSDSEMKDLVAYIRSLTPSTAKK